MGKYRVENTVDCFDDWLTEVGPDDDERQTHVVKGQVVYGYNEYEWEAYKDSWRRLHKQIVDFLVENDSPLADEVNYLFRVTI